MSASGVRQQPRSLNPRLLVLGFVGTLVLASITVGIAATEMTRIDREVLQLADESQRSTYYLGDVGEQLARLRSHVALGLRESPAEFRQRRVLIEQIERTLQTALDALPAALEPATLSQWIPLEGDVARIRASYRSASDALAQGDPARASVFLVDERSAVTHVHDSLDRLAEAHRETLLARLRRAHLEASRIGFFEIVLAGVFFAGMVLIWTVVMGALIRQKRQLDDYTQRLESANADLDAFAGRVAHDLKNALAPIAMAPLVLRRFTDDPTRVLDIADRTERSTRRAVGMVDALLAFSQGSRKAEDGESGALQSAVRDVLEELGPRVEALGVTVAAEGVPDLHVRCNPGLLHVVLANVCGNAVKFLDRSPERRVRIAAFPQGERCCVEIEDTGPGIPVEARERIFEPFFRVAGSHAPGSGIGLATVRRIVEARGGRIEVQSAEGGGTRFRIWFPLAATVAIPPVEAATALEASLPG